MDSPKFPRMSEAVARFLNRFAGRVFPTLRLGRSEYQLVFEGDFSNRVYSHRLSLSWKGYEVAIRFGDHVFADLFQDLCSAAVFGSIPADLQLAACENALQQVLRDFAQATGDSLAISAINVDEQDVPVGYQCVCFKLVGADHESHIEIQISPELMEPAAAIVGGLPRASGLDIDALEIPLALRVGAARLSWDELQSLRSGDVLLADLGGQVQAVLSQRVAFLGILDQGNFVIEKIKGDLQVEIQGYHDEGCGENEAREPESEVKAAEMDENTEEYQEDADSRHATVSEHPVSTLEGGAIDVRSVVEDTEFEVSFELAQINKRLGDIQNFAVGGVITLPEQSEKKVALRVAGKEVGRGILVDVEGRLAVQISELLAPAKAVDHE